MVDIKRQDITLNDWTKWISVDEFTWWSYYYAAWIQSWYNTKWFKLWYTFDTTKLNDRAEWYPVAWYFYNSDFVYFTKDGKIETYNNRTSWAIFSWIWNWYKNWIVYQSYAIWIWYNTVDIVPLSWAYVTPWIITDNDLTESPASWTLWTWWSYNSWAVHESGTWTNQLTTRVDITNAWNYRVRMKIEWMTAWSVKASIAWVSSSSIYTNWDHIFSLPSISSWTSKWIRITPTDDFDWTITFFDAYEYNSSIIKHSITASETHPCIMWQWDLYIWSKWEIWVVNLSDYQIMKFNIIDKWYEIIWITQQAWSLIIWATDGINSKQYYWNWVDEIATEVIEWNWIVIRWAKGTWTIAYVLTWANWLSRLYAVSWYSRSLIATNEQNASWNLLGNDARYNIKNKFDFSWSTERNMHIYKDSLYIAWVDGMYKYWSDIPWLNASWTQPIKDKRDIRYITDNWENLAYFVTTNVSDIYYPDKTDMLIKTTWYISKWYLVCNNIYWDKLSSRKALEKIKIWYKQAPQSNIKVYVIVDDDYFWRFKTSSVLTWLEEWAVYGIWTELQIKIIQINWTDVTWVTISNQWMIDVMQYASMSKVSGNWPATILFTDYDNMCFVRNIESETYKYWDELIFGKDFVSSHIPYWYKIWFVVELATENTDISPEIYDLSIVSDVVNNDI